VTLSGARLRFDASHGPKSFTQWCVQPEGRD
jgi:hypothetical protein